MSTYYGLKGEVEAVVSEYGRLTITGQRNRGEILAQNFGLTL